MGAASGATGGAVSVAITFLSRIAPERRGRRQVPARAWTRRRPGAYTDPGRRRHGRRFVPLGRGGRARELPGQLAGGHDLREHRVVEADRVVVLLRGGR